MTALDRLEAIVADPRLAPQDRDEVARLVRSLLQPKPPPRREAPPARRRAA